MRTRITVIIFLLYSVLTSATRETYSGYFASSGFASDVSPNSAIIEARHNVYLQTLALKEQQLLLELAVPESNPDTEHLSGDAPDMLDPEPEPDHNATASDNPEADNEAADETARETVNEAENEEEDGKTGETAGDAEPPGETGHDSPACDNSVETPEQPGLSADTPAEETAPPTEPESPPGTTDTEDTDD